MPRSETMSRLHELARCRVDTRAAADAIATTARALAPTIDVEVREAGPGSWLVIVEALHAAPAIGETLAGLALDGAA